MKKVMVALSLAVMMSAGVCAQNAKQAAGTKPAEKQAKTSKAPAGVPADAVEVREGVWRAVDKKGTAWLYTATPFGFRKTAEDEAPAPTGRSAAVPQDSGLKVTGVDGDDVKLEAPSPFGTRKWTKKRADLTAGEQSALDAFERGAAK